VESDCSSLIRALGPEKVERASCAGIISEITVAANLLPACKFTHVNREANQVAHQLAQRSLRQQECMVMHHNLPEEVRGLVQAEGTGVGRIPAQCNSLPL
jgi:hypothetical protein